MDVMVEPIPLQASEAYKDEKDMYVVGLVKIVPAELKVTGPVAECDKPGGK